MKLQSLTKQTSYQISRCFILYISSVTSCQTLGTSTFLLKYPRRPVDPAALSCLSETEHETDDKTTSDSSHCQAAMLVRQLPRVERASSSSSREAKGRPSTRSLLGLRSTFTLWEMSDRLSHTTLHFGTNVLLTCFKMGSCGPCCGYNGGKNHIDHSVCGVRSI